MSSRRVSRSPKRWKVTSPAQSEPSADFHAKLSQSRSSRISACQLLPELRSTRPLSSLPLRSMSTTRSIPSGRKLSSIHFCHANFSRHGDVHRRLNRQCGPERAEVDRLGARERLTWLVEHLTWRLDQRPSLAERVGGDATELLAGVLRQFPELRAWPDAEVACRRGGSRSKVRPGNPAARSSRAVQTSRRQEARSTFPPEALGACPSSPRIHHFPLRRWNCSPRARTCCPGRRGCFPGSRDPLRPP